MRESGFYAPGTEHDPRAPWNEVDHEADRERVLESVVDEVDDADMDDRLLEMIAEAVGETTNGTYLIVPGARVNTTLAQRAMLDEMRSLVARFVADCGVDIDGLIADDRLTFDE